MNELIRRNAQDQSLQSAKRQDDMYFELLQSDLWWVRLTMKLMAGLIRHTYGAEATSADAFVPILIFVVLRANPENMLSNVE